MEILAHAFRMHTHVAFKPFPGPAQKSHRDWLGETKGQPRRGLGVPTIKSPEQLYCYIFSIIVRFHLKRGSTVKKRKLKITNPSPLPIPLTQAPLEQMKLSLEAKSSMERVAPKAAPIPFTISLTSSPSVERTRTRS